MSKMSDNLMGNFPKQRWALEQMSAEQVFLTQPIDGAVSQDSDNTHSKFKRICVYLLDFRYLFGLMV